MSNLTVFKNDDGIEIVINTTTGESFASQRATARMCGVSETAIRKFLGANQSAVRKAEILTAGGLQGANLLTEDTILDCLEKYNFSMLRAFAKLGVRHGLHELAGYKVTSTAIAPPDLTPRYLPMIEQADKAVSVAERYKAVFGTINPQIEQHLKDLIGNTLVETNRLLKDDQKQHSLWMGVVNFAEVELGYSVPSKGGHRGSALGKWIRHYHPQLSEKQERRFCNETQREIWVYPVHLVRDQLTLACKEFFSDPNPGEKLRLEGAFKRNK